VRHFICSNSRHGTHSPFVYRIAQDVVYNEDTRSDRVGVDVDFSLRETPRYFPLLEDILSFLDVSVLHNGESLKGAYWTNLQAENLEQLVHRIEEGQILVIHEPYRHYEKWKELILNQAITVSIDFFYFSIVLKRETQRKEDFKLRYPYWRKVAI